MPVHFDRREIIWASYADANAYHGDLGLTVSSYGEHICKIVDNTFHGISSDEFVLFVKALNSRDLYLTTACADGMRDAWNRFDLLYKEPTIQFARTIQKTAMAAYDLADTVFINLFLPNRSGRSRIYFYNGKSSIMTWLRVVVNRCFISTHRVRDFLSDADCIKEHVDIGAERRMQSVIQERRYGYMLTDSVEATCQRLSDDERHLLLWRYNDGLQLGEIARIVGVHQANVTRRLKRLQTKMRVEVIAVLSAKYHLSQPAIAECLADVLDNSQYSFSLVDILKNIPLNTSPADNGLCSAARFNAVAS